MSVQMQATKRRINSIVATRKITSAMELIAVTKLQRWQSIFIVLINLLNLLKQY